MVLTETKQRRGRVPVPVQHGALRAATTQGTGLSRAETATDDR